MGNCFVSQLDCDFDANLPKFGTLSIKLMATPDATKRVIDELEASVANPVTLKISNGGFYVYHNEESLGDTVELTNTRALKVLVNSGGGTLDFTPKYNMKSLSISKYKVVNNELTLNGLVASDYVIRLDDFSACTLLESLLGTNDVYGDISSLSACIRLNYFSVTAGKVTGEVKDLVSAWIDNGRESSGNMVRFAIIPRTSPLYSSSDLNITLNGTRLTSDIGTSSLYWESKDKIYLVDGTKIKCTGYTDSEIATNTGAGGIWKGKTVVKF